MRFGNDFGTLKKATKACTVISAVFMVFIVAMATIKERMPLIKVVTAWPLWMIFFLFPAVVGLAILPTILFSIHIEDGRVRHLFLDRWVLGSANTRDFDFMQAPGGFFAAILHFKDGTKIRFFGAGLGVLADLEEELSMEKANECSTSGCHGH